jgi:hypothetical protein
VTRIQQAQSKIEAARPGNPCENARNVIAETAVGGATGTIGTVREYIYLPEAEISPTMQSATTVDRPLGVVNAVNTTDRCIGEWHWSDVTLERRQCHHATRSSQY